MLHCRASSLALYGSREGLKFLILQRSGSVANREVSAHSMSLNIPKLQFYKSTEFLTLFLFCYCFMEASVFNRTMVLVNDILQPARHMAVFIDGTASLANITPISNEQI